MLTFPVLVALKRTQYFFMAVGNFARPRVFQWKLRARGKRRPI